MVTVVYSVDGGSDDETCGGGVDLFLMLFWVASLSTTV